MLTIRLLINFDGFILIRADDDNDEAEDEENDDNDDDDDMFR